MSKTINNLNKTKPVQNTLDLDTLEYFFAHKPEVLQGIKTAQHIEQQGQGISDPEAKAENKRELTERLKKLKI